jgi:hypothetical protein
VGQRTLVASSENAPNGAIAVAIIRPRSGGSGLKYTIPAFVLANLGSMNENADPRARYDAVMAADGLFKSRIGPIALQDLRTKVRQRFPRRGDPQARPYPR